MSLDIELPTTTINPTSSQGTASELDILSRLPALIWTTDHELRFTAPMHVNPISVSVSSLLERPIAVLFRDCAKAVMDHHRQALTGVSVHFNFEQDGRIYQAHITPRRSDLGDVVGVLGIALDITEHHKQAQIKRHMRELELMGQLAGSMAHDFNNLLTVISSYAQFLLERFTEDDDSHEDAQVIQDTTRAAVALVRQLLTFSRQQLYRSESLDMNAMVERIAKAQREVLPANVNLVLETHAEPCPVLASADSLEQALSEIVCNAREAMPKGGTLVLEVSTVDLDRDLAAGWLGIEPGRHVLVTVSDTGCGMSRDVQARMFEPFFTTKVPKKRAGLGASAAHGILRQCNAGVWVHSMPGTGTTFKIYLPHAEQRSVRDTSCADTGPRSPHAKCILIVEGDDACSGQALVALRDGSHRILSAHDWDEAAHLYADMKDHIELILCDVIMPNSDGAAFCQQVRATQPSTPILWMSGYTQRTLAALGVPPLAAPLVSKPLALQELQRQVDSLLSTSQIRRQAGAP